MIGECYNIMEENICKICGKKYSVIGLDVFERCVKCLDEMVSENETKKIKK